MAAKGSDGSRRGRAGWEQVRSVGAVEQREGVWSFTIWAPFSEQIDLRLLGENERSVRMERDGGGYHQATVEGLQEGDRYLFRLASGAEHPDPASRFQPDGVHGPSALVSPHFEWETEGWSGIELHDYIFYELHVGTFTPQGTFDAAIGELDTLVRLGVTAVEVMPVAQFPGERNWGYDGVYMFAVQESYGGPDGFRRFVDACHARRLAVVLDVVYNHFGPEGNYISQYGPYFTDKYKTPWGAAINFDGPHSDEVRNFFIANALSWVDDYRVDALRLDAVHAIVDESAFKFLEQLADRVHERADALGRKVHLIAESDLNDPRLIRPREAGGYALDAQWNDDFHHALHALLTGESFGYYEAFGDASHLERSFEQTFVYAGDYSPYRQRRYGAAATGLPPSKFVVFSQNHDQVGNRMLGERLSRLVSYEKQKMAAALVLLSPFLPLLFMGEEYGETAPFLYFTSHGDPGLVEAVREGRRKEFASFRWKGEPPAPESAVTFEESKLRRERMSEGRHARLFDFYRELTSLRKRMPLFAGVTERSARVEEGVLSVRTGDGRRGLLLLANFSDDGKTIETGETGGVLRKIADSADVRWEGPGTTAPEMLNGRSQVTIAPQSVVAYSSEP